MNLWSILYTIEKGWFSISRKVNSNRDYGVADAPSSPSPFFITQDTSVTEKWSV